MVTAVWALSVALAAVVCAVVGKWLFGKDSAREERRKHAFDVSAVLTHVGLKRLPRILRDYAVGDYSGMLAEIVSFAKAVAEDKEAALVAEFEDIYKSMLANHLGTADGRALVAAMLKDAVKPTDPAAVQAVKVSTSPAA